MTQMWVARTICASVAFLLKYLSTISFDAPTSGWTRSRAVDVVSQD
jgi:hypothetical protein